MVNTDFTNNQRANKKGFIRWLKFQYLKILPNLHHKLFIGSVDLDVNCKIKSEEITNRLDKSTLQYYIKIVKWTGGFNNA